MQAILSLNQEKTSPRTKLDVLRVNLDTQCIARDNLDNYDFNVWAFVIGVICTFLMFTLPMFATESSYDIMGVIDSNILRGNNQIVAKYSGVISVGTQFIITACGFFIIALKTCTIAFTILYLTHPRFWNSVSDAKERAMESAKSQGNDWLATIVSWLTPDVKALSEYGQMDEESMYDVGGLQTVGTYIRKNIVQFIVLLTLASILWSGKLLKLVGLMSKGCEAVVDFALNIDYGGKVTAILEADRDYQFMYDVNSPAELNKQNFAKQLYSKVKMAVPDNNTSDFYNSVGDSIKELIGNMNKLSNDDNTAKYVNWANPTLYFTITWNTSKPSNVGDTARVENGIWIIPASTIVKTNIENVTTTQMQVSQNGVFYVSFTANQVYQSSSSSDDNNQQNNNQQNNNQQSN